MNKFVYNLFKNVLPVLICLGIVLGISLWIKVNPDSQVQFTSNVIVSLSGIPDGSLYIASSSECTSFAATGTTLTVNGIPDGSSFILKTPQYDNALKITPSGGAVNLSFSSENLNSGVIYKWTLSSSDSPQVEQTLSVLSSDSLYTYKISVAGDDYGLYKASNQKEITITYDGDISSPKVFSVDTLGIGLPMPLPATQTPEQSTTTDSATTTQATTTDATIQTLRARIAELNAMIDQLKAQLARIAGPSQGANECVFAQDLQYNDKGENIRCLQTFLKEQGNDIYPEGLVTGYFGNLTKQAVIRFQEKYFDEILKPWGNKYGTGFVGPTTRAKINEILNK